MNWIFQPSRFLLLILASWVNPREHQIITFQRTEIEVLKEKLDKNRILFNDD